MLLINQVQHSYLFDSDDHIIIINTITGLPYELKLDLPWSTQVLVFHELLQCVKFDQLSFKIHKIFVKSNNCLISTSELCD